jgi:two-component system, chemotaxis family, protein-glutamate methylesterase/glutaminase
MAPNLIAKPAPALIVIGASLGGLLALRQILQQLRPDFSIPIAIAQHRHRDLQRSLVASLQESSPLPLREVEDKDEILPGKIYLAPADYHLLVELGYFGLSTDLPVSYARPSIDVLFESAADAYGNQTVGVILTGANQDGAVGAAAIKAQGGLVLVQKPETAESAAMPAAAIAQTCVDSVLSLSELAAWLNVLCECE